MPSLEDLFVTLSVKDGKFSATMNKGADSVDLLVKELVSLNKAARKTGAASNNASKNVDKFNNSLLSSEITAAAFAYALQRVLANALNAFVEFEQGIIDVTKVVSQFAQDDIPQLQQSIINLTQTLPLTRTEILSIGQALGQLGFFARTARSEINDAFSGIVELVGQVSVATDLTSEQAAQSFGVLRNVFLDASDSAATVTDTLRRYADVANEISNTTAATATDVVKFNAAIGATATQLGLSFQQVSGYGAAIRQLGISSDVGATALQRFFGLAVTRAEAFANAIGTTEKEFREAFERDPNEALLRFFKALNEASTQRRAEILKSLSAEQRLVRTLNGIANNLDLVTTAQKTANDAFETGGSVLDEYSRVANSTQANLIRFNNTISNTLLQGFEKLAPVVNTFLRAVTELVTTFPNATLVVGAFVVAASGVTAALLAASILIPRIAQGYALLTARFFGTAAAANSNAAATGANVEASKILQVQNAQLGRSLDLLAIKFQKLAVTQTLTGRVSGKIPKQFKSISVAGSAVGGVLTGIFGTVLIGALLSASSRIKELAESIGKLDGKSGEALAKSFKKLADQIGATENHAVALFNLFTTGKYTTLADVLRQNANDILEAQGAIDRFFARAVQQGNQDDSTAAQIARADLLGKAYKDLGSKTAALAAVNVGSADAIRKLREEYGATTSQLIALAKQADKTNPTGAIGSDGYRSNVQRVTDLLATMREEQAAILKDTNLTAQAVKAVEDARKSEQAAAEGVLSTLQQINKAGKIDVTDSNQRQRTSVDLDIAVRARRQQLEDQIKGIVARIQGIADEEGANVSLDIGDGVFDITNLSAATRKEVRSLVEAVKVWQAELAAINSEYETTRQIITGVETAQERQVRTARELLEDNSIALRREQAQRAENFDQLKAIDREEAALQLQRLQREEDAAVKTVENERTYQARRTIILRRYAAQRLQLIEDEATARREANQRVQEIINTQARTGAIDDDLSQQRDRLAELRALSDSIVNSVADESVKREGIKTILEQISNIARFGIQEEIELRKELIDLEQERTAEIEKRIRQELVAADNVYNEVKRTANLNTRIGRQAVEAAEVERDLQKEIATLKADGIVTASEINQIEQRRLEAAQRVAELTGQTRQAAGRDQLQDDLARIRDEANAQRAALENVAGLDEQAIVDSGVERDLQRRQSIEEELNGIISIRTQLNNDVNTALREEIKLNEDLKETIIGVLTAERARDQFNRARVTGEAFDPENATGVFPDRVAAAVDVGSSGITDPEVALGQVEAANVNIDALDVNIESITDSLNTIEEAVANVNTAFDASAGSVNVAAQGVQTSAANFEATLSPTLKNITKALEASKGAFDDVLETVESIDERVGAIEQTFRRAGGQ